MNHGLARSMLIGLVLGSFLFALAPLGLGLSIIENLKPVLAPGVYLVRLVVQNTDNSSSIAFAWLLNVNIYIVLTIGSFSAREHFGNNKNQ